MKDQITAILYKHVREEALSAEEQSMLDNWLEGSAANKAVFEQIHDKKQIDQYMVVMLDDVHTAEAFETFRNNKLKKSIVPMYRRWWAAASVLILLAAGAYFWLSRSTEAPVQTVQTIDIQPGKQGAILTLADGSQILLDTVRNGQVAMQGGVVASVTNGKLAYEGSGSEVVFNRIATPNARQFQLVLPDGTEVWLNAASSIRYPTVFAGNERKVEITGEAYFEVAKDTKKPFVVNVRNRMEVLVLGTHFNVNAYENESEMTTTLLEGAVKVLKGGEQREIRPGEQAQVKEHIKVAKNVDTDKVMAWKNGLFDFENTSLEAVMRQLERWYDIEVVYENGVPDVELDGKMTKDVPLNGLLKNLKELGVHYRMEGRRLIVLPNGNE